MSKFKFTSEMFMGLHLRDRTEAAELAQAALDKHIESLPKVYGATHNPSFNWTAKKFDSDTHVAVLFDSGRIKKKRKKCEHVVIFESTGERCGRCGKHLVSTVAGGWKVKK